VGLCLTSGQVFRWSRNASDVWTGVDGPNWFRILQLEERLIVETNGQTSDLERFFQLHLSARDVIHSILSAGPELEPYLGFGRGLRVLRYADPVECLFTFLCSANNHVPRISAMVRHLATLGPPLEGLAEQRRFPGVERLAAVTEEELRSAGFGYRAASLPKVAALLRERGGDAYVWSLQDAEYEEARDELISLPSVGPKLADCIALFGLGFGESVPVDTHIWKAATRIYFPNYAGLSLTPQKYEEFATFFKKRFGANAGWAHQALFYEGLLNWRSR